MSRTLRSSRFPRATRRKRVARAGLAGARKDPSARSSANHSLPEFPWNHGLAPGFRRIEPAAFRDTIPARLPVEEMRLPIQKA